MRMFLDRREFAAGSAALLSGCAIVGTRRLASCTSLPPVDADPATIQRIIASNRRFFSSFRCTA
jgi:hypothetical protein